MTQTDTPTYPADAIPVEPPPQRPAILAAIKAVMAEVRGFPKTGQMMSGGGRNARVQYTFQRWDDMVASLGQAFRSHGVATKTAISNVDRYRFEKPNYEGKPQLWTQTLVVAKFSFVSLVDGSEWTIESSGEALDNSDKGVNKALTAAYKNACKIAFVLSAEDDGDPDDTRLVAEGERVRNAQQQNGQPQQYRPDEREMELWRSVEQIAAQPVEQNSEPSRVEFARKVLDGMPRCQTTGDLATMAAWALGKGALAADPAGGGQGPSLAHRIIAMRGTLPVGPRRRQGQQSGPEQSVHAATMPTDTPDGY